jgi:DNA-binding transcriptional LysR family regulator
MDLKELRYFRAIAELGSFSKAAAFLNVAQPALSRQIQKLEHDLGVTLLLRTARGVTATTAGKALLSHTVGLENEMANVRRDVSRFAEHAFGFLNIAAGAPHSTLLMPGVIKRYKEAYPDVSIHIIDGYSGDLTESLLGRKLELAVVDAPTHPHADLHVYPLWMEPLHLVGPASQRDSEIFSRAVVDLQTVANLPLIASDSRHAIRRTIEAAFSRKGLKLRPTLEVDGYHLILEMVKAGLGYALLPQCTFYDRLKDGQLVHVEVRPTIRRIISIVTRAELLRDRIVMPLIELIKKEAPLIAATERYGPAALWTSERRELGSASEEAAFSF